MVDHQPSAVNLLPNEVMYECLCQAVRGGTPWLLSKLSDVSAFGTYWGVLIREDFWLIVVTEGNEDEVVLPH